MTPDVLAVWNFVRGNSLFRRGGMTACGGYQTDMVWGHRIGTWLACAARRALMKRVPEALFYCRISLNSRSVTASEHHCRAADAAVVSHHSAVPDTSATRHRRGHM